MVSAVNLTSLRRVWHLCNWASRAYTLFRFFCIARYVLRLHVLSLQGQRFTYSVNILLSTCILYCDAGPGRLFDLNCRQAQCVARIYLSSSSFSSDTAYFEKAIRFSKGILMFFFFFLHQFDRAHSKEKQQLLRDKIALLDVHG